MSTRRFYGIIIAGIAIMFFAVAPAAANKSGIRIEVPETVEQGKTPEIVLHVSHSGNNFMHYTQWVELKINGEVVEKWEYSATSKPPEEDFVLTYFPINICNLPAPFYLQGVNDFFLKFFYQLLH